MATGKFSHPCGWHVGTISTCSRRVRICLAEKGVEWESVHVDPRKRQQSDVSIAPFLDRFEANKQSLLVDWRARLALGDWWARMQARPGYIEALAFADPDLAA